MFGSSFYSFVPLTGYSLKVNRKLLSHWLYEMVIDLKLDWGYDPED